MRERIQVLKDSIHLSALFWLFWYPDFILFVVYILREKETYNENFEIKPRDKAEGYVYNSNNNNNVT